MNPLALAIDMAGVANVVSIVSIALTAAFFVFILLGILFGMKRGLILSLLRFGTVIVTVLLSLVGTLALRSLAAKLFDDLLVKLLASEYLADYAEFIESSETITEFIRELPSALAGPFVFFALFLIISAISYTVYLFLKRITVFRKELFPKKTFISKILGATVCMLSGFVVAVCVLMPFSGYVSLAGDVVHELNAVEELDEDAAEVLADVDQKIIAPLDSNVAFKTTNVLLEESVFNRLTVCKVAGSDVVIKDEVAYIAETYTTAKPLIEVDFDFTRFEQPQADALRKFAADFNNSVLIPHIVAEIIPKAAEAWNNDEAFLGIENPLSNTSEELKPLVTNMFTILETTTYDTLQGDLVTIAELIASLAESGTFALLGDDVTARDIVLSLSEPGLVSGLIDTLYENKRMQVLVADLANLGFDAVGKSLAIPETDEAVRADLTAALNEEIKKTESIEGYDAKISTLTTGLKNVFKAYGVEATEADALLYAECIIGVGPITGGGTEVTVGEYFSIIGTALNQSELEAANRSQDEIISLSSVYVNEAVTEAVRKYRENNDSLSSAIALADGISGKTDIDHSIITIESILLTAEELFNVPEEDFKKQSKALEEVIILLSAVLVIDENNNISLDFKNLDTEALSASLHNLADTRKDATGKELHNFATAITNLVKSALQHVGIDAGAANNLVDHMLDSKPDTDGKKKDSLSTAFVVVDIMGNENATNEDIKEAIGVLVKDLDKESADVLSDCVSSNLINNFAPSDMGQERTDALVNVTHDLLENFGEHAEELSEEQLEAEAIYMQTIFELAMSAGEMEAEDLFITEENGEASLGKTATEFVDVITHSTIISETFIEHTEDMKTAINDTMSQSDKEVLADALLSDESLSENLKDALKYAFGLEGIEGLAQ